MVFKKNAGKNKGIKQNCTSHNKRYTLRRLFGGSGLHSPRSLRSHGSFQHIFVVAGMLRIPLSQPQKRRIQPERYATSIPKTVYN